MRFGAFLELVCGFAKFRRKRFWILSGALLAVFAPARAQTPAAEIGPNVRIGPPAGVLPADQQSQAEPQVARSWRDPNFLVAAYQAGRFASEPGGALACGYSISHDGGVTWSAGFIPEVAKFIDGGPNDRLSDPVAALNAQDQIFITQIGIVINDGGTLGTILTSAATDGQFQPPRTIFKAPSASYFPDKEWVALNRFPGTARFGRIDVTFTDFSPSSSGQMNPIAETHSDDGGQTWSAPQEISSSSCQGSQPIYLPDGSLAAAFWNFSEESGGEGIDVVVSNDGGETFGAPVQAAAASEYHDPVARNGAFLPSLASDALAGALYLAYASQQSDPRIFFTRSIDRGATWSPPQAVNDGPGAAVYNPNIAVSPDGQHVLIVFCDKRNSPDDYHVDLYLAESFDGGDRWAPNVRVSDTSSDLSLAPLTSGGRMLGDYEGIAADLNFATPAVAIWADTRSGHADPFSAQIQRLKGTRFAAWQRLRFSAADLAQPDVSGPAADPDGDGLVNLWEYALGREPRHPDALSQIFQTTANSGQISVAFERLATLSDLRFFWERSTDLAHWTAVAPLTQTIAAGHAPWFERVLAAFPSAPDNSRQFFRLRLQQTP